MNAKRNEYVVIVGCGRLGGHLANELSRQGHSIVVIDVQDTKLRNLSTEFSGFRLEGDASELEILKRAKTHDAHKLIAVTGDDNVNLTVAQMAKTLFHVPTVVARVSEPQRAALFGELGIYTVCPVLLATEKLLHRFSGVGEGKATK